VLTGCKGGTNGSRSDAYCEEGHEGPLCAICSDDFYFNVDLQSCEQCSSPNTMVFSPTLFGLILMVFVVLFSSAFAYFGGFDYIKNMLCGETGIEAKMEALSLREKKLHGGDKTCITTIRTDGLITIENTKQEEDTTLKAKYKYTPFASVKETEVVTSNSSIHTTVVINPKGGLNMLKRRFQNQFKAFTSFFQGFLFL
jgi:hypothetical protein